MLFWSFASQFYIFIIFHDLVAWFRFDCSFRKHSSLLHFFSLRKIWIS